MRWDAGTFWREAPCCWGHHPGAFTSAPHSPILFCLLTRGPVICGPKLDTPGSVGRQPSPHTAQNNWSHGGWSVCNWANDWWATSNRTESDPAQILSPSLNVPHNQAPSDQNCLDALSYKTVILPIHSSSFNFNIYFIIMQALLYYSLCYHQYTSFKLFLTGILLGYWR